MDSKNSRLFFPLCMLLILVLAGHVTCHAQEFDPQSYIPKSIDGVLVKTCAVDVSGRSTCDSQSLGDAALDLVPLGLTIMTVSGLTGSEDKRWNQVVYGVTDKLCSNGGVSMGIMRTQPGITTVAQNELAGLIASNKLPMEMIRIEILDTHIGYLQKKDCIMAFGYPNDSIVLVVFAGKGESEMAKKVVKSMLESANTP